MNKYIVDRNGCTSRNGSIFYFSFFLSFFTLFFLPSFLPLSLTTSRFLSLDLRNVGKVELYKLKFKVKWYQHRSGVAQRVGRVIALIFHDRSTRRGWEVSSTSRPHFTPGKDPVPILQEAGWAPGPVWTGGISCPHRDLIPDRLARSQVAIPTELPSPHKVKFSPQSYTRKMMCFPQNRNATVVWENKKKKNRLQRTSCRDKDICYKVI